MIKMVNSPGCKVPGMLFNSYYFLLFFPVVTVLYFLCPAAWRWLLLLVASCVFYMVFRPVYILVLFAIILVDYCCGIMISEARDRNKGWWLFASIVANLGILFVFKYFNFFAENVNHLLGGAFGLASIPLFDIALPIGLSFHTFQAMSYTLEVYRGRQKPERHLGIYALYVLFYPQLVAGPIERPQNMLPQFHERKVFSYDGVVQGLQMMIWGFFKKVVIADRIAQFTGPVFKTPGNYHPVVMLFAIVFFSFELFCDFSGYSNIALGAAQVMGFKLMVNFNWPFSARSVSEFWRRWHISLSTWFNDYLFSPMLVHFRDWGVWAVAIATLVTFLLSGLWHGADWKFVVYGGLHGMAVCYEVLTKNVRKAFFARLPKMLGTIIGVAFTFSFVTFAFVFFRADSIGDAIFMISKVPYAFTRLIPALMHYRAVCWPISFGRTLVCMGAIVFLLAAQYADKHVALGAILAGRSRYARWAVYYCFVLLIIYAGVFENRQFIYFQF